MTTTDQAGIGRAVLLAIGVVVSAVANYLVAYAIYDSSYGSVFFMDDDVPTTAVWMPLLAGAILGCVEGLVLGARATLVAAGITLLAGIAFVYPVVTVALVAVGVAAGGGLAAGLTKAGRRRKPSTSGTP